MRDGEPKMGISASALPTSGAPHDAVAKGHDFGYPPVEHLLLLLRTDTLVFEKEIQELRLREVKIILVTHHS